MSKLLDMDIKEATYLETQRTIKIKYDSKYIRVDVYIRDEENNIYNVEMQQKENVNLPKRARYYQAMLDLELVEGNDYTKLNDGMVVFICTFDPFGLGKHMYKFENRCVDKLDLELKDGTAKIFINTKGTDNKENAEYEGLLKFIEDSSKDWTAGKSKLVDSLYKKVQEIKSEKEMEVEFMTLQTRLWEYKQEGMQEGMEKGMAALISTLQELGATKEMTGSKLAQKYNITKEEAEDKVTEYWKEH